MDYNEMRKVFALDFLGELTKKEVPYAVQRNIDNIVDGTFKDIDLIAPQTAFAHIKRTLCARQDVTTVNIVKSLSRSELAVDLVGTEKVQVLIDLDYQVTLIDDCRVPARLARLLARSVSFSDLKTQSLTLGAYSIMLLSPDSELLLLRNHFKKKAKASYMERIAALERDHIEPSELSPGFQSRGLNLSRRYLFMLLAMPAWVVSRIVSTS